MAEVPQGKTETDDPVRSPRVSVPVEYNARDLLLYAVGIGSADPRYVHERHPDFAAFPTYPFCLMYKGDSFDALSFPAPVQLRFPGPRLKGVRVVLDAEKYIEKVTELPPGGAKLRLVVSLLGVHQKGKGALVEQGFDLVDESGKVYYKIVSGAYCVGAKDFEDAGVTHSQAVPPPAREPAQVVEVPIDPHIANIFRLSGDYNPLHIDPEVSRAAGFERPILHGLCTLGHTTRAALEAAAGGDQRRFRSVQMRFASPVVPGQHLLVEIWRTSPSEVVFQTRVKETGKVCISNGLLRLVPGASL